MEVKVLTAVRANAIIPDGSEIVDSKANQPSDWSFNIRSDLTLSGYQIIRTADKCYASNTGYLGNRIFHDTRPVEASSPDLRSEENLPNSTFAVI